MKKTALVILAVTVLMYGIGYASANYHVYLPIAYQQKPGPTITPPPTATSTATMTPTSTPTQTPNEDIYILDNFTYFVDESGLHIFGEVQNDLSEDIYLPWVGIDLYNGDTFVRSEYYNYLWVDNLPSGERSCFEVWIDDISNTDSFEFVWIGWLEGGSKFPNISVFDTFLYPIVFGYAETGGKVTNNEDMQVLWVMPVITAYDPYSYVVGCTGTYAEPMDLNPGQPGIYDTYMFTYDPFAISSYYVQVDGERASLAQMDARQEVEHRRELDFHPIQLPEPHPGD